MAVGSDDEHNKSEYFDNASQLWVKIDDYPYGNSVASYVSIHLNSSFYIIGGTAKDTYSLNSIARLDTTAWSWSLAGKLNNARFDQGAIWLHSRLIVVGGTGISVLFHLNFKYRGTFKYGGMYQGT